MSVAEGRAESNGGLQASCARGLAVVASPPIQLRVISASLATGMSAEAGDEGVLTVTDNGPGVAPGYVGRLLEPFFTTKEGGMRLGLSVSLSLAQAQGGRLWYAPAEADRPRGFALALPLANAPDE